MTSVPSADPVAHLKWHYENSMAQALERHSAGIPVVGVTSNTVPWELISAAGLFPVMLRSSRMATPFADEFMEDGVFHARIRGIFNEIASGEWQFLRAVIIPRTSEQEYKLFLYLREVTRERPDRTIPPVYLYDLLHCRSDHSYAYGLQRTEALQRQIEEIAGSSIGMTELKAAIAESNAARSAVRELMRMREGVPRISGCDALALAGPFWFMDRSEYAGLALRASAVIGQRSALFGPRLLVKGLSLESRSLHEVLESHGAVVVAEDDWWGSRSAGEDIDAAKDGVRAVFEKCYFDSPSPRIFPPSFADEWFQTTVRSGIDGVVFYLPQEDYVAGWDYPRHKSSLDKLGVPSLLLRSDAMRIDPQENEIIEQWLRGLCAKGQ
jgi:benzoyl-CoA reductase/2-hydroxyglutaryl-CoA dehydratase subunit BcrC/BadD/HgdB